MTDIRIFLVEDDSDQAAIFKMRLSAANYGVNHYVNGQFALQALEGGNIPDLIITDLMMPVMDGFELIEQIYKKEDLKKIPIIVLTAVTDIDNKQRLSDYPIAEFCEKTQRWKHFQEAINKALNVRAKQAEAGES